MGNGRRLSLISVAVLITVSSLGFLLSDECDGFKILESEHGSLTFSGYSERGMEFRINADDGYDLDYVYYYPNPMEDMRYLLDYEKEGDMIYTDLLPMNSWLQPQFNYDGISVPLLINVGIYIILIVLIGLISLFWIRKKGSDREI